MYDMIIFYLLIGLTAGFLSGLLGIGGGTVIVPALVIIFHHQLLGNDIVMHLAAGTSLMVMVFTTGQSLKAHSRVQAGLWPVLRDYLPSVLIGTISGAVLAHFLHSDTLIWFFVIIIFLIAMQLFFQPEPDANSPRVQARWVRAMFGFMIGLQSGMLGLGGGTFTVPYMRYCGMTIQRAVAISSGFGVIIAFSGAISFMVTGLYQLGLPHWSTGYVYWPAVLGIAVGSLGSVRVGAKCAHLLPTKILQKIFAVFLLVVSMHLLLKQLGW